MRLELYVDKDHPQVDNNITYLHLTQIQSVDNASCAEIEVGCLDYALERDQVLQEIINKLRYGGIVHVSGTNLTDVMFSADSGSLNIMQLQQLLYAGRLSADSCENMIAKLTAAKLTIIHEVLMENRYFISAKREMPNA